MVVGGRNMVKVPVTDVIRAKCFLIILKESFTDPRTIKNAERLLRYYGIVVVLVHLKRSNDYAYFKKDSKAEKMVQHSKNYAGVFKVKVDCEGILFKED